MKEFTGQLIVNKKCLWGRFAFDEEKRILYFKKANVFLVALGMCGALGALVGGGIMEARKKKGVYCYDLSTLNKVEFTKYLYCKRAILLKTTTEEVVLLDNNAPNKRLEYFKGFIKGE